MIDDSAADALARTKPHAADDTPAPAAAAWLRNPEAIEKRISLAQRLAAEPEHTADQQPTLWPEEEATH